MDESELMEIICNTTEEISKEELIDNIIEIAKVHEDHSYSSFEIYINDILIWEEN